MLYCKDVFSNSRLMGIWEGKAMFILQRALPLENLVVNGKLLKWQKNPKNPRPEATEATAFMLSGLEFHLWEGKTMFTLQRALPLGKSCSQWETFERAKRPRPGATKAMAYSGLHVFPGVFEYVSKTGITKPVVHKISWGQKDFAC